MAARAFGCSPWITFSVLIIAVGLMLPLLFSWGLSRNRTRISPETTMLSRRSDGRLDLLSRPGRTLDSGHGGPYAGARCSWR
jgi:hypothetical protein